MAHILIVKNIYIYKSVIVRLFQTFFVITYSPTKLRNFGSCAFNFQPTSGSLVFLLHSESTRHALARAASIRWISGSPQEACCKGQIHWGRGEEHMHAFWTQQECVYTFSEGEKTGWKPELRITNIRQRKSFGSVSGRSGVIYRSGRREQPAGPTPIAAAAATSSSPLSRSEAPRTRGNAPQCSLRPPPPPTNRRVSCWMALIQCCHDLRCDCVRPSCS